jgi:hypothetical protein
MLWTGETMKPYGEKLHENLIQTATAITSAYRLWLDISYFALWQQYQREADIRVAAQVRKIMHGIQ